MVRPAVSPHLDVRRAADRPVTRAPGLVTAHAFSFGRHYDPDDVGHGVLLAHNDDRLAPGAGYDAHPHRDLEIVTWVLSGTLRHEDDAGGRAAVGPGSVQVLSAGAGVVHSERNAGPGPLHLVQAWVTPDVRDRPVRYLARAVDPPSGALVPVASGRGHDGALPLGSRTAVLHVARLRPGQRVRLPEAPLLHLALPLGSADLDGVGPLGPGDAVRVTGGGGQLLTAVTGLEALVWELHPA